MQYVGFISCSIMNAYFYYSFALFCRIDHNIAIAITFQKLDVIEVAVEQ